MTDGAALVTGASGGIGWELAWLLARDGSDLVLVARSESKLQELAAALRREYGVQVHVVVADLSEPEAPAAVFRATEQAGISVHTVINNAGFGLYGPFLENERERQLEMIRLNVLALTDLSHRFLPGMVARGRGSLMNVASMASFVPGPGMAVYYATKAFVLSLSEALSEELRGTGVSVTAFCPGPTRTGFQDVAAVGGTRLFRSPGVMDVKPVARAGYEAMKQGAVVAVPGIGNRVLVKAMGLMPRGLVRRLSRIVMQQRAKD